MCVHLPKIVRVAWELVASEIKPDLLGACYGGQLTPLVLSEADAVYLLRRRLDDELAPGCFTSQEVTGFKPALPKVDLMIFDTAVVKREFGASKKPALVPLAALEITVILRKEKQDYDPEKVWKDTGRLSKVKQRFADCYCASLVFNRGGNEAGLAAHQCAEHDRVEVICCDL